MKHIYWKLPIKQYEIFDLMLFLVFPEQLMYNCRYIYIFQEGPYSTDEVAYNI